jgi:hypothetical protein
VTYLELITNAYRLRNVIDENDGPSAEQGVAALTILNQMMEEWQASDVCLQYVPIDAADLGTDITIPKYAESGVTAALAIRLVAGGTLTPELQGQFQTGYGVILRKAVQDGLPANKFDHIPAGSARRRVDYGR